MNWSLNIKTAIVQQAKASIELPKFEKKVEFTAPTLDWDAMRKRKTVESKLNSVGDLSLKFEKKMEKVKDFRKIVPISLEAIVQAHR